MSKQDTRVTPKRQGGRRHKGERHPTMVRFPKGLYYELKEAAAEAGYGEREFGDFVIELVRQAHEGQLEQGEQSFAQSA